MRELAAGRKGAGGAARFARPLALLAMLLPAGAGALEPRFDHRDEQGGSAELLVLKDVLWKGSRTAASSARGAVRLAWSFDPTGDGNELFIGATYAVLDDAHAGEERLLLTFDARYRACVGDDEFKTLLEVGIWSSAVDRWAAGPLVGLGFMYDFSRNFGVFASATLAAGAGERRVFTYGGGLGAQYRFE